MDYDSDSDNSHPFVDGNDFFDYIMAIPSDESSYDECTFDEDLPRARANNPEVTELSFSFGFNATANDWNHEQWKQIGRDLSNNIHLENIDLCGFDADGHKIASLFRGLTKSTSIRQLNIGNNGWSAAELRCLVPFLQNASNLRSLGLTKSDNIQSEGFTLLLRALRDSPIQEIYCGYCGIDPGIDIEPNNFPKKLENLYLCWNNINSDGCHEIAKLLRREDTALTCLGLNGNDIGDAGVAILVDALQSNATLERLEVYKNGISQKGQIMLLQLVNDISSVEATLRSNHTLTSISVSEDYPWHMDISTDINKENQDNEEKYTTKHIKFATDINEANRGDAEAAGSMKLVKAQLNSVIRAQIAELLGVSHTLYSEINPLHLPEVLSLVSKHHGFGELYAALKLSIGAVISMIDTKQCVKQCYTDRTTKLEKLQDYEQKMYMVAYDEGRSEEMYASLTVIDAAEGGSKKESESNGSLPRKRSHLADDSATLEEQSSEHEPQLADCIGRSKEMMTKLTKTTKGEEIIAAETEADQSHSSKRRCT